MKVREIYGNLLFYDDKNDSSQHRPPDSPNAADHRHEQDVNAGLEGKDIARIKEGCAPRINTAGDAGEPGGNSVDPELGGVKIHSQVGGGILVLLDCTQGETELAVGDDGGNKNGQGHSHYRGVVVLQRVEGLVFCNAIAAGPAGNIKIVHDHADGFGDADGGNDEVWTAQPERGQANQERRKHGNGCAANEAEVRVMTVLHQERRGVCAQTKEDGKSERDLARHTADQVPAEAGGGPDGRKKKETDDIVAGVCRRKQQQKRQQQPRQDQLKPPAEVLGGRHAVFHLRLKSPASPFGIITNTTTSKANGITGW